MGSGPRKRPFFRFGSSAPCADHTPSPRTIGETMPLLDELFGYPSLLGGPKPPQSASNPLPSYDELRPYLTPDVFERFRPQFEAVERMTAPPRDIPRQIPTDPTPSPAHPLGSEPTALPSYETLRPYLDPKLFEAFKPQFQAFERMTTPPRNA